jgi:hypothetical protein
MYFLRGFDRTISEQILECPGDAVSAKAATAPRIVAGPKTVVVCCPNRSDEVSIDFTPVAKTVYTIQAVQDQPFLHLCVCNDGGDVPQAAQDMNMLSGSCGRSGPITVKK